MTPVVDNLLTRPDVDVDGLVLLGMSLGGLWAARAAAYEHRFRAAVLFDGVYDLFESLQATLPGEELRALDTGDADRCEQIVHKAMTDNTALRWTIENGMWTFGASGVADFIAKSRLHTVRDVLDQVRCPYLVLEAEGDMFFSGQPKQVYDALTGPKKLVTFTSEDGAENHCQGALSPISMRRCSIGRMRPSVCTRAIPLPCS